MWIYMLMYYMFLFLIMLFFMFLYFLLYKVIIYYEIELLKILSIKIEILILLDWISLLFMSVVLLISLMVIFYSIEYMLGDLNLNRFMKLVIMFVISMILMILSPNMVSILIGWDGLGLVSYCLVIYYQSESSYNSGMVTVLTNRIGDIMILMIIGLMIFVGSWNFMFFNDLSLLMLFLLIMASITKSAQIPFSSWLPMAMAAPTPVSSLVHSSTLVTAGVYLLIRFNYLMMSNLYLMKFMMLLSIFTMLISGLGANFESDFKKVIAMSTLSQLGVMIFCLSLSLSDYSFFHLVTHAMFKSMLFMCAGVVIHNMINNQNIYCISMVFYNMPMVSMFFCCLSFSLCGVPFMSGFYWKDMILEMYLMGGINKFIMMFLFISMGLTVSYSTRLMYYSFIKIPQMNNYYNIKSFNNKMILSMMMLYIMSIMIGLILSWLIFSNKNMIFLSLIFKLMIYFYMFLGGSISLFMSKYYFGYYFMIYLNLLLKFYSMLWFMPMLYGYNVNKLLKFSKKMTLNMEFGWNELFIGNNFILLIKNLFKYDYFFKNYFYLLIFFSYLILLMMLIF